MEEALSAEVIEFLNERRHAILATNQAGGPPHLSPVWYLYEEGAFYVSVRAATVKARNLALDPRLSLAVDGGYPDWRSVIALGSAELVGSDSPAQAERRRAILRRYYGNDDDVRRHVERTPDSIGMLLLVIRTERVITQGF